MSTHHGHDHQPEAEVIPLRRATDTDVGDGSDRDRSVTDRPTPLPATVAEVSEPIEGELLSAAESAEIDRRMPNGPVRQAWAVRLLPAPVAERVSATVHHPTTMAVGRVSVLTLQGGKSWAVRAFDAGTLGIYRRQIRAAEAIGDNDALREWTERREVAVSSRHQRIMELPRLAFGIVKVVFGGILGLIVTVVIIAAIVHVSGSGTFAGVIDGVLSFVRFLVWLITIAWTPVLIGAPMAVLYGAYKEGTRRGEMPRWTQTPAQQRAAAQDEPITPSLLTTALRDLGVAKLREAVKASPDAGASMLSLIRLAGCGVEVDVTLPSGVSTEDVQKRRKRLAENLHRHEHEVFITIPQAARTVRLWIADSGALDEPIGPSPLVIDHDATADVYSGRAPWGQNLRGDTVSLSLMQRHLLVTGLSNQGKTAALRALALWLVLDRYVELHIADLKGVGDWRMFDGLATTLIQGPTDEHVIAATEMLEWGVAEMERRIAALEASGATDGVTRDMARAGIGFHPLYLIVDEAQVAFMCPAVGDDKRPFGGTKATSRYFMAARKIHNQGRAVNVCLWQGTQDPTDQNLPKLVREGAHIRASLVVGSEEQGRMALGDKAIDGGAAPHKLRQGQDKGTLVVTGDGVDLPAGQASVTVRTHFVNGSDAATIADRARTLRNAVATRAGMATDAAPLDTLADIAAALDTDAVRTPTRVVLSRLMETDPRYESWSFGDLATALAEHGTAPAKYGGNKYVRHTDITRALTERDENGNNG